MSSKNPRRAAFDILLRIEKEKSFADILIDHELSKDIIKGADRGLLTELVYGVLRRQGTLDYIISQFSKQRPEKLELFVRLLLRLGIYQCFFLDRVPVSAAVNETVNLAKELAPRASGFINAVLRNADRGRDTIAYPDRAERPAEYLAARYSHPAWLAQQWCDQLGLEAAEELAAAMSEPPPLTVRVNTLRITREELIQRLAGEGVSCSATSWSPDGIRLNQSGQITRLPSFRDGLFTVQDESSQLAPLFLAPGKGERVLDACAAPGGKTTQIAQLMQDSGEIYACDVNNKKLRLIKETCDRLGINSVRTFTMDATAPSNAIKETTFHRILVDAPCSGLGVIRRNPEGKWSKSGDDLLQLARTQVSILENLCRYLEPKGTILYATCSTSVQENEYVVDSFLAQHPEFVVEDLRPLFPQYAPLFTERGFFRSWPHRDGMDGFFSARLKRK
ncbi:16S rRNA (5-methyl-C967)-methyltransferase [Citrifermentans bemidjiense Bem]|uniref:16S rRNA (cytosine(967)-C(5))-methyltransferase n=1 Tax=Citrifermentans bemidjiense (strain ATCC BAA-1014 / DSM 16622 / JCM 12645 / Bem) TaxID=404380 RepID=B5EC65_CITBB|nr:16S rRNA (cytosine(967)-C(5))-methyltransferase RsmB [Citrifermentans bemidjiense]ACH40521.1 16S rRNA (5-methyl-C967)-methyltransferase [Citrifermentans bemidjiense Bem]